MDGHVKAIPTILLEVHGTIPDDLAGAIRHQVEVCYEALPAPLPATVILGLFDTFPRWQQYAARRRQEAGVITAGEEGFLATHDAWEGIPRLNVCLERLLTQPWLVQEGALHQVVAHSILHGRPECYRFVVPHVLLAASAARGLEQDLLLQVLYFVAIAIKGHAAVSLLVENDFVPDQIALARYQLAPHEDDEAIWKMARWEPRARLLYLSAQLRPLLYLRPLLPFAPDLLLAGREMLAHLPPEEVQRLEMLVDTLDAHRSGDLHDDVSNGLGLVLSCL